MNGYNRGKSLKPKKGNRATSDNQTDSGGVLMENGNGNGKAALFDDISFQAMIENAPDGITLIDREGNYRYISPAARRMFGYLQGEQVSMSPEQSTHPDDLPLVVETLKQVIGDPTYVPTIQYRFVNRDGSWRWIESSICNLLSTPGVESIAFNFRDISERKKAEEEIRQSEEKFKMLLELATDAFFQGDSKGNFILVNSRSSELTGYSREELLQMNISQLFDSSELIRKPLDYQKLNQGETVSVERLMRRKDGEVLVIEMHSRAMPDGTYQSFFRDITMRRKVETELEKQRSFFEQMFVQSATSTQILDPEGWCLRVNPKLTELFGVQPEAIEGRVYNIFSDREIIRNGIDQTLETVFRDHQIAEWEVFFDVGVAAESVSIDIKEPKRAWFANKAYPILDEKGGLVNVIIQHEDITKRRSVEEALRSKEEQLLSLINGTQDIICFKDGEGRWLQANDADLELFGLKGVDYYLKKDSELAGYTLPAYYEAFMNCMTSDEKAWQKGSLSVEDEEIPTSDGRIKTYEVIKTPLFNDDGSRKGLIVFGRDVTERKLSEQKLKESEDKFRTLAESAPYAIMIYQDDHWIYTNPAGERISGYSAGELFNMQFWELAVPEYRDMIRERGMRRQQGLSSTPAYEFKIKTKNGEEKWVFLSGSTLLFKGRPAGIISVIDITERKQAEEAVQHERMLLRTLIDNLPDTIYFKDRECRKIVANRADLALMGLEHESQVTGKTDMELFEGESGRRGYLDDRHVIETGLPLINSEDDVMSSDGRLRWMLTTKIPLRNEFGITTGLVGIGHDITERKQAEKIQRVLFQISNAVLITSDLDQLFQTIREQLGTLLDTTNFFIAFYDEKSDMLSSPFFMDEKDTIAEWPASKSMTGYVIRNKKSLLAGTGEIERLIESGQIEIVGELSKKWLGVPLMVEGKAIGALVVQSYQSEDAYSQNDVEMLEFVSHQISLSIQRKQAEQELRKALVKAEESDRLKTAFLNNMSHEIRTPLNGILGFTSLLGDPDTTPEDKQYFYRIINQNGEQLLSIINDIISIATIEAGQEKLRPVKTGINEMMEILYEQFKHQAAGKNLLLNFRTSLSNAESVILTDETKLRQVLVNLIGNAFKFTDQGMIEFGCLKKNEMLEFYVKDTGIGIAAEMHHVIFERFRQANANPKKEYGGNGLGLAISKAYIELMGGKIWLESSPGKGATFIFSIPYIQNPAAAGLKATLTKSTPVVSGKGKTLLVAEDTYANFQLLDAILRKHGFRVIHVENGIDAVEMCRTRPEIDLVFMDMKMPEMDGYVATGEIKKMRPALPVVAVTAYALGGDKDKALKAGCDDYIAKPVKPSLLIDILNRFITDANG